MDSDTKAIVSIILAGAIAVSLAISSVAWPIVWYYKSVTTSSMENGYEETTLPGVQGVHWVKKK